MSDQVTVQDVRIHPQRTLWILMLGAIACALAQTMVVPALPQIQRDFHVDAGATTWLLAAFLPTSSVSTPILGRFGDMYGARWPSAGPGAGPCGLAGAAGG